MRTTLLGLAALFFAGAAGATDATDAVARPGLPPVHVPASLDDVATRDELRRFHPTVVLDRYGDAVTVKPRDVVVIEKDHAEADVRGKLAVTFYNPDAKITIVKIYVGDVEDYLNEGGLSVAPHVLRTALGRLLAHELEHVRRGSGEHDKSGFFKAHLTRHELLAPRWGV